MSWNPVPSGGDITYNFYFGTRSHSYQYKFPVGNTNQVTLFGLDASTTYYFAVTAVAGGLESGFSDEMFFNPSTAAPVVQLTASPRAASTLTIAAPSGHTYEVLATQDFQTWQAIGTATAGPGGTFTFSDPAAAHYPARFYRLHEVTYTPPGTLPVLKLLAAGAGSAQLQIQGQFGHTYDILATQDFGVWNVIGTVTAGAGGTFSFQDPDPGPYSARFYFLHEITYANPQPSFKLSAGLGGYIQLQVSGLAGHTYEILVTQDGISWMPLGEVTIGLGGQSLFTDPMLPGALRFYSLREVITL